MAISKINTNSIAPSQTLVTPVISGLMDLQGGQIKFPSSQLPSSDANTLDDYEEGTWSPTLFSSGYTLGFAYQNGWYVKIGQFVWLGGTVGVNSKSGSGTSTVFVSNLPFQSAAGQANEISALTIGYSSAFSSVYPTTGYLVQGTSSVILQAITVAAGSQSVNGSHLTTSSYMNFTIAYRCNA